MEERASPLRPFRWCSLMPPTLIRQTEKGLYCPPGDFFLDPWKPVPRALISHAHSDHACPGSDLYLAPRAGEGVLRLRIGADANIDALAYGEGVEHNGVRVSFHPAGHVLGSAQVRLEH